MNHSRRSQIEDKQMSASNEIMKRNDMFYTKTAATSSRNTGISSNMGLNKKGVYRIQKK